MSSATKDALSQADIILNRTNVALARSQRLIQSWLPPKPATEDQDSVHQPAADEDEDFRGDSEVGGIGSAAQKDDSGLPEGAFKRRNLGANDKLLDSLLGKKAANAHRKAQAEARGRAGQSQNVAGSRPPVKETAKRPAQDSDSEEEGGGRAAAFVSKRAKPSRPQPKASDNVEERDTVVGTGQDEDEPNSSDAGAKAAKETNTPAAKGGKKRPASYLDELLGQKANKKSKKKKKSNAAPGA